MTHDLWLVTAVAAACFATALLSAIAGFGGGVLLLPVFVAVFLLAMVVVAADPPVRGPGR
jgi:uncharacterized membrane protein YfcA